MGDAFCEEKYEKTRDELLKSMAPLIFNIQRIRGN